jgi:ankyrin repeat protein
MSNATSAAAKVTADLMVALIKKRDTGGLKKLIDKGALVNTTHTAGGQSLVMLACSARDIATVQMLITAGCNFNYLDKASTSVVSIVSSNGSTAILQLLIKNGLDQELLSKPNFQGCTPAHFAAQMGMCSTQFYLLACTSLSLFASPFFASPCLTSSMFPYPSMHAVCQHFIVHI